jgi:hypothetical protein
VPKSWITARFPREPSRRKTRGQRRRRKSSDDEDSDDTIAAGPSSKPQKGHGWISF